MSARGQAKQGGGSGTLLFLLLIVGMLYFSIKDDSTGGTGTGLGAINFFEEVSAPVVNQPQDNFVLNGVQLQERTDQHATVKHGTLAQDILNRAQKRECWYSASREIVMVLACDTANCAMCLVDVRGKMLSQMSFAPADLANQLEITTHIRPISQIETIKRTDGYVFMMYW